MNNAEMDTSQNESVPVTDSVNQIHEASINLAEPLDWWLNSLETIFNTAITDLAEIAAVPQKSHFSRCRTRKTEKVSKLGLPKHLEK